jgi:hypothetical protein|tara:strand:- start:57 stop:449 length:393 start_codon:yes stop_codon:yes gene_type:complete
MFSSSSQTKLNIEKFSISGDRDLNNFIEEKVKKFNDKTSNKKISIIAKTNYSRETQTKDKSGNTTQYKLKANVEFLVTVNNTTLEIDLNESLSMNKLNDEFEQKNYEKSTKDQFSTIFVNRLLINLSRIE